MNVLSTLAEQSMQAAERYAKIWGLDDHQIQDAISIAWEFAQRGQGTPKRIAIYAVKRVYSGGQFGRGSRYIGSPTDRPGQNKPKRVALDVDAIARFGGNPSVIAAFRIDFAAWLDSLPERLRAIAESLGSGETTSATAQRFGVSSARISQLRDELEVLWWTFHCRK